MTRDSALPGRVMASRALTVLLTTMTLMLAACTPTADGPSGAEQSVSPDTTPHATYTDTTPLGTGDGALLEGTLQLRNCLVVGTADATMVVPIFQASTTTWSAQHRQLTVATSVVDVGGTVAFGGSYITDPGDDITIPPACASIGRYFLVSTV